MARGEITGKKPRQTPPPAAYTIAEFCLSHRIAVSMYYKLKTQGLGPREMAVGSRRYISFEAAAEWRRAREHAAIAAA